MALVTELAAEVAHKKSRPGRWRPCGTAKGQREWIIPKTGNRCKQHRFPVPPTQPNLGSISPILEVPRHGAPGLEKIIRQRTSRSGIPLATEINQRTGAR